MALPTSVIPNKLGRHMQLYTISAQTASFDFPFQVVGAFSINIMLTGTIGTATNNLQVSGDNVSFKNLAMDPSAGGAATAALVITDQCYGAHRPDLGWPFWNLHHVAGGGSSIAFVISIALLGA